MLVHSRLATSALRASFGRAIKTISIAYQPILRARDRSLFGYEALLRSGDSAFPDACALLTAAERLKCVPDLGRTVRSRAAATAKSCGVPGKLFINLHACDLLDPGLSSQDAPLSQMAACVVLEITERASLDGIHDVSWRIARLREMGFQIAIDDLGAGYAGLTSFALLEPEVVKLDMTLVRNVHNAETKQKLIRAVASLCRDLGILVVAEGVESAQERDVLIELGCDLLQGYLFAKPAAPFPDFSWEGR